MTASPRFEVPPGFRLLEKNERLMEGDAFHWADESLDNLRFVSGMAGLTASGFSGDLEMVAFRPVPQAPATTLAPQPHKLTEDVMTLPRVPLNSSEAPKPQHGADAIDLDDLAGDISDIMVDEGRITRGRADDASGYVIDLIRSSFITLSAKNQSSASRIADLEKALKLGRDAIFGSLQPHCSIGLEEIRGILAEMNKTLVSGQGPGLSAEEGKE